MFVLLVTEMFVVVDVGTAVKLTSTENITLSVF